MDPVIKAAYEAALQGQSFAFATILESSVHGTPRKAGAKMIVLKDGSILGTIGGGAVEKKISALCRPALKNNKSQIVELRLTKKNGISVCGGRLKVLIEPFIGRRKFIICGAGHIALPLSLIAKILNYYVIIIDNRARFANSQRFPHVDEIHCGNYLRQISRIPFTETDHIAIMTHNHKYDYLCLKKILTQPFQYLGIVSSHHKKKHFLNLLKQEGVAERKQIDKIKMPIGLAIGAQTPEEIAISIIAEIIKGNNH